MSVIFKLAAFVGLSFLLRSLIKDWIPIVSLVSSFEQGISYLFSLGFIWHFFDLVNNIYYILT